MPKDPHDADPPLCDAAAIEAACDEAAGTVLDDLGSAIEGYWADYLDEAEVIALYGVRSVSRVVGLFRRDVGGGCF